ncbi:MAG: tyrosine-type recombinase/integrase [Chthoniobacterales bacterium]
MASVLQRGKKKTWYAVFRDLEGRQLWRKLDAVDRKSAEAGANLLEATAQKAKSAQYLRKAFTELYQEVYGEAMPTTTAKEYAKVWLEQKKHEVAPVTHIEYERVASRFCKFLGERANRDLADITKGELVRFRNELAAGLSAGRVNFCVKVLRMFFRSAHKDGYLLENPAQYLETVRNRADGRRRPLTVDEIRAVLAIANPEWQSLIRFGLYTGQRLMDLALLTWSGIDLERGEIRLTTSKTGRRMTIPMAQPLREYLVALAGEDDPDAPLHPRAFAGVKKDGRTNNVSNQFVELLHQAGLREAQTHQSRKIGRGARRQASNISFHSLRHAAVSLLKDSGIPEAVVMELIGHDSKAMSAHYTHVGTEALEKAVAVLPGV